MYVYLKVRKKAVHIYWKLQKKSHIYQGVGMKAIYAIENKNQKTLNFLWVL